MLALDTGPCRRRNYLARLRLQVAKTDLLVLAGLGEMLVVAARRLAERRPRLDRDLAIGFRRQIEDRLGGVDVAFDARTPLRGAAIVDAVVEGAEALHLGLGVPA